MSPGRQLARLAVAHVRKIHAAAAKAGPAPSAANWLAGGAALSAAECQVAASQWPAQGIFLPQFLRSTVAMGSSRMDVVPIHWTLVQRSFTSSAARMATAESNKASEEAARRDSELQQAEDPFDTITDRIPEKPVSVAEGASYTVVIVAFLGLAAAAMFYVAKELLIEPKEYKVFNKALDRVKNDSQVAVRIGRPITGYGSESRNRAARQRIRHNITKDEDGTERVQVQFFLRGPNGTGMVTSEMFKDQETRDWQFTYLIVDITSPVPSRLMLESYLGGPAGAGG
ncbi:hypothetical protein KFL_003010070 [Klebsormidium nitens]|uniref:Mitochondrial import inner membrane translocase subunit Tim21 n=1 Tax=Klebsormidium nitens TaxID=105231 RepID=A0A1Y1IC10_KLENI|nr:hypothetical protein KFL_003010070 [Klebsormidium nitens]|eukprot:GAQ86631.1 hypothetical protein KFL_003010070 [Klebsormidium nitens]